MAGFLHKLAAFSRLILLDRLGNGLSDRGPSGQSFEDDRALDRPVDLGDPYNWWTAPSVPLAA